MPGQDTRVVADALVLRVGDHLHRDELRAERQDIDVCVHLLMKNVVWLVSYRFESDWRYIWLDFLGSNNNCIVWRADFRNSTSLAHILRVSGKDNYSIHQSSSRKASSTLVLPTISRSELGLSKYLVWSDCWAIEEYVGCKFIKLQYVLDKIHE